MHKVYNEVVDVKKNQPVTGLGAFNVSFLFHKTKRKFQTGKNCVNNERDGRCRRKRNIYQKLAAILSTRLFSMVPVEQQCPFRYYRHMLGLVVAM